MGIEIHPKNDTEVRQSLSIYPNPAPPIHLPPVQGFRRAKFPGIDTEELHKICLSVHITVATGKEVFLCRE